MNKSNVRKLRIRRQSNKLICFDVSLNLFSLKIVAMKAFESFFNLLDSRVSKTLQTNSNKLSKTFVTPETELDCYKLQSIFL